MGVVVLQAYPVPQDKTAAQVIDFIQKRVVNLGATMVTFCWKLLFIKTLGTFDIGVSCSFATYSSGVNADTPAHQIW